jgi:hypothetical protein
MKLSSIFICLILLLSLTVYAQDFEIKIDGEKDAFYNTLTGPDDGWLYIPPEAFNGNGPQPVDEYDLSANWFSAWDDNYLYVYVQVMDDILNQTNGTNYWANDCFDAKIDADFTSTAIGEVFCFAMTYQDSGDVDQSLWGGIGDLVETVGGGWVQNGDSTAIKSVTADDYARNLWDYGYILECRLNWEWVVTNTKGPLAPQVGDVIGFAVSIHDNDLGTGRDKSIEWAASVVDGVWSNCTYMGYMEMLADHKIRYVPESLIDPSIVNPNPDMYIPAGVGVSEKTDVVKDFTLLQNYPNPFNPVTTISYTLPKAADVKISVYDFLGNEVATLVDGMRSAGTHTTLFDGANLSSGIYFYKLQAEGRVISKKMALIK